jgi:hypothetical protein
MESCHDQPLDVCILALRLTLFMDVAIDLPK